MTSEPDPKKGTLIAPLRPRVFWTIVRVSGLLPMTITFITLFVLASFAITLVEPGLARVGDAAWFLFTVITTIGLGDFTCTTLVGRLIAVGLSIYSVFYLAIITGTIVSYCNERMRLQRDESVAAFVDKLCRLPEMSHDELVDLSERIKKMRK